jgi:glycosyltransferase involved in cell wall biosynthesis
MNKNIIYISYDGMHESLGKSQVLSYLNLIAESNITVDLISYEKTHINNDLNNVNISKKIFWHKLIYHKKFKLFSAVYDILIGYFKVSSILKNKNINLIHCRSYISAIIALISYYRHNVPFIFDMRGLWIDEKIESGSWNNLSFKPIIYFFRQIEKLLFKKSISIITLTESSKVFICQKHKLNSKKVNVIPTCVNYNLFFESSILRKNIRNKLNIDDKTFLLIYSGSIGGYYRLDYIFDFFEQLKLTLNCKLLLLTNTDKKVLFNELYGRTLSVNDIIITKCDYEEVNNYLNASDAGLIIYEKTISSLARSSTKLAEYWACNLPVFAPGNVGDLDYLFKQNNQSHLLIKDFDSIYYNTVINSFVKKNVTYEFNKFLRNYFDVQTGVEKYLKIYHNS